jgi:hypothetical protein
MDVAARTTVGRLIALIVLVLAIIMLFGGLDVPIPLLIAALALAVLIG